MFTVNVLLGSGIGFVAGAFVPAVGRKLKALFVKETQYAEGAVKSEVSAVEKKI